MSSIPSIPNPSRQVSSIPAEAGQPLWTPKPGLEWQSFISRVGVPKDLDQGAQDHLLRACQAVLGRCAPPDADVSGRTGLVIGCIQSGKTLSFTGVTCLARDNGVRLVVVISGTANNLLEQTRARLEYDLGLRSGGAGGWSHVPVDPGSRLDHDDVANKLRSWDRPNVPLHLRRTVIVTVLKNASNLRRATGLLRATALLLPDGLRSVSALIVDDEADQASLNTRARLGNGESATYQAIRELRSALPSHNFVQYTATAQAPLLLSIADMLSPHFCYVLEPGRGYTGGKAFLAPGSSLVRTIPDSELPPPGSHASLDPCPSLLKALSVYLLGLAASLDQPAAVRSMLIHPSRAVQDHAIADRTIKQVLRSWSEILAEPADSIDRRELVEDLQHAWDDLSDTVTDLKPLAELVSLLPLAIGNTTVRVLNFVAGTIEDEFPWANSAGWILIGGQALDRGFTVKGLTVTHMARDLPAAGQANADTLQQRARFFGYRAAYLPYCRVWLTASVRHAMTAYVEHEEALRDSLRTFATTGRHMRDWRRAFLLDSSMAPTRRNVLQVDYQRVTGSASATQLREPFFDGAEAENNKEIISSLLARPGWTDWFDSETHTAAQRHRKLAVPIRVLMEDLLALWHASYPNDSEALSLRLVQANALLARDPSAIGTLVHMSPHTGPRMRTVDADGTIVNLMQGRNPARTDQSEYPGDSAVHAECGMTVQLHILNLTQSDPHTGQTSILAQSVPTLVIFCLDPVDLVVQNQGIVVS